MTVFSRYERTSVRDFGRSFGTGTAHAVIRKAIQDGTLDYEEFVLHDRDRLDHVAAKKYGTSSLWWVIAAASNVGWGLQLPPGTVIRVPSLERVVALVG